MLKEKTLFGTVNKIENAINLLKDFEPEEGYYLADSGGKDSCCILALAKMANVKFDSHHSLTTIDPPELIKFIKKEHPETAIDKPKKPLVTMIIKQGYPTRQMRWCCAKYKERGGDGRFVITGVRKQESHKRSGRKQIEICYKSSHGKRYINPIIDWSDSEVWDFIKNNNISYCKLYDEGWHRIGCLFCPMNTQRRKHVEMYPGYVKLFIKYFNKRYAYCVERKLTSSIRFKSGEEMFWFWINEPKTKDHPDQMVMFE